MGDEWVMGGSRATARLMIGWSIFFGFVCFVQSVSERCFGCISEFFSCGFFMNVMYGVFNAWS